MAEIHDGYAISQSETQHEKSDVNVRALLWSVAIFIVFAICTHGVLWWMFKYFVQLERGDVRPQLTQIARPPDSNVPAEPRLQPFSGRGEGSNVIPPNRNTPVTDMEDMRVAEEAILQHYGWVDRQQGVVHIPITVAKQKLVAAMTVQNQPSVAAGGPVAPPALPAMAPAPPVGAMAPLQSPAPAAAAPGGAQP